MIVRGVRIQIWAGPFFWCHTRSVTTKICPMFSWKIVVLGIHLMFSGKRKKKK